MSLTRIALMSLATAVCVLSPASNRVCFALPNYSHTATVKYKNPGGPNANDLHVSVPHTVVNASATGFTKAALDSPSTGDVTYTGGTVAPGGSSTVTVVTKFRSDIIDLKDSNWTLNGKAIGALASNTNGINPIFTDLVGGKVEVALNNTTGSAVAYANLSIFTGANKSEWTVSDYLGVAQSTGAPVSLLVPDAGTLAAGMTEIAVFAPSVSLSQFDAGSASFSGDVLGVGDNATHRAEPSSVVLLLLGAGTGMVWYGFRKGRAWSRA